jgi:transporter family-2 protein
MTLFASGSLALAAGAALAAQSAINARLGVLLQNPVAASTCAFFVSLCVSSVALALGSRSLPSTTLAREVPIWLWFTGGTLSFVGVATFYWLIPRVGVGQVVVFGLVGQLLLSTVAAHWGWFQFPVQRLDAHKLLGLTCLVVGAVLIQRGRL